MVTKMKAGILQGKQTETKYTLTAIIWGIIGRGEVHKRIQIVV
jgi:hypothetical protein